MHFESKLLPGVISEITASKHLKLERNKKLVGQIVAPIPPRKHCVLSFMIKTPPSPFRVGSQGKTTHCLRRNLPSFLLHSLENFLPMEKGRRPSNSAFEEH